MWINLSIWWTAVWAVTVFCLLLDIVLTMHTCTRLQKAHNPLQIKVNTIWSVINVQTNLTYKCVPVQPDVRCTHCASLKEAHWWETALAHHSGTFPGGFGNSRAASLNVTSCLHLMLRHSVAMVCRPEAGSDFVMHVDTCIHTQGSLEKHRTITDFP